MALGTMRRMMQGCLLAGICAVTGCAPFLHPVPPPDAAAPVQAIPHEARRHVYTFLIDGVAAPGCGELLPVRNYLWCLDFPRTYWGQCCHSWKYASEIRHISAEDPNARFVLVGFGVGKLGASMLASELARQGIVVHLVVELHHSGAPQECGEVVDETTVRHLGHPSDPETLMVLGWEIAAVAGTVPVAMPLPAPPAAGQPEVAPPPRMLPAEKDAPKAPRMLPADPDSVSNGWDLLRPVSRLRTPPSVGGAVIGPPAAPQER
jgi:hypothetical protein